MLFFLRKPANSMIQDNLDVRKWISLNNFMHWAQWHEPVYCFPASWKESLEEVSCSDPAGGPGSLEDTEQDGAASPPALWDFWSPQYKKDI